MEKFNRGQITVNKGDQFEWIFQQVIEYYENNPFSALFPPNFVSDIKKYKGKPQVESICRDFLNMILNLQKSLSCQMLMSFVVCGVEANSRYPDRNGLSPKEIYMEQSFIVQYLDYFIEKQIFCIEIIKNYFKPV